MAISPLELESKSDHAREDDTEDNHNGSGSNSSDESFGSPLHRRRSNRQRIQSIEIEDEEFGEALGLLGHPIANHTDFEEETPQGRRNSARAWVWWIVTMILVAVISRIFYRKEQQWVEMHGNDRLPPVSYECPVADDTPKNDEQAKSASHSVAPPPSNIPGGDSVEYSYEQLRTNFKEWTVKHIAPYILKSNDEGIINRVSILETASHTLGLNLFLTLDILEEIQASSNNPTKFWVYGNDRDPFRSSFAFFRQDREKMAQLPNVHLGMFCAAEDAPPMDLSYIPEEAFDIVYCGHLPAMPNPLDFTGPSDQWFTKYQNICTSEEHDWQGIPLKDVAQETQEAWFASWLGDMARVVKPGGLLVLENLAVPFCENLKDEGGVPRDWWATVAQSHQEEWTIDHTTITLGNDDLRNWRYHVVMRKKDPIEEKGSGGAH